MRPPPDPATADLLRRASEAAASAGLPVARNLRTPREFIRHLLVALRSRRFTLAHLEAQRREREQREQEQEDGLPPAREELPPGNVLSFESTRRRRGTGGRRA